MVREDANNILEAEILQLLREPFFFRDVGVGLPDCVLVALGGCRGVGDAQLVVPSAQLLVPHGLKMLYAKHVVGDLATAPGPIDEERNGKLLLVG